MLVAGVKAQCPCPEQSAGSVFVARYDTLKCRMDFVHGSMDTFTMSKLAASIFALTTTNNKTLTVGTGCSGSDAPVMVLRRLVSYWQENFGFTLKIHHRFSVEVNTRVQQWIQHTSKPDFIFEDVRKLGQPRLLDVRSGDRVTVPTVDLFVSGFECDTVSSANNGDRISL
jgi:hypothetical protein